MQNRLEIVAANLIAEFNLTKEGLDAIVALYHRYYAEVAAIYAAMNSMLAGQGALQPQAPSLGGGGGGGGMKKAEGGMVLANRPTTATFGEAGLEMATHVYSIGKRGKDVNKLFSNLSGRQ